MRVLLGMSGGVDSTVAVHLLQQEGYQVVGLTIRFWEETGKFSSKTPGGEPAYIPEARAAAAKLGIEHFVLDATGEFRQTVIDYFVNEYQTGRTPFPCATCNINIKWPLLLQQAQIHNCDKIATGHYANIVVHNGQRYITQGVDPEKDQAFFLWGLGQDLLRKIIFPLGGYLKQDVKELARTIGLKVLANKKESMGVCFIQGPDYRPFLQDELQQRGIALAPGNFILSDGTVLGHHQGCALYTVGQRRGLGLNLNEPMFVKEIRTATNQVVLGQYQELYKEHFMVRDYNLVAPEAFEDGKQVIVKIRYRMQATPAKVHIVSGTLLNIELLEPLESIAPGQTAVFYEGNRVLGGGFIA